MLKNRNIKYNINSKVANETLQNVFAACEVEPNETPLEVIRVWNIANAAVVKAGFWIANILLIIILLMPFAFRTSDKANVKEQTSRADVQVAGHYIDKEENCFVMILSGSGIVYDEIYAKKDDGSIVKPSHINREENMVYIPFKEGNLNIYIPKEDGSVLQAVLSK